MTATLDQTSLIASVVEEVLRKLAPGTPGTPGTPGVSSIVSSSSGGMGLFASVHDAVAAAARAQEQLIARPDSLAVRGQICDLLKKVARDNAREWGRVELEETKVGRLDHKIAKLELLEKVPGVEFLKTAAHSGDSGISLDEAAPWGVIGVITPVTHSIPTLTANAIAMIAAGNALVVNAHPSGAKCAAMAAQAYNRQIKSQFGVDPLICVIDPPTLRSAEEIFEHPNVHLLVATGGPAVARAAMKQTKRAIVAGPGNPPVVVDETADLDNAARSIVMGGAFDNNLLCIGEKEVFVVACVFDKMMTAMSNAGAMRLSPEQVQKLIAVAFKFDKDHFAVSKDLVGKDPQVIGQLAGFGVPAGVELLFGETTEDNPFVSEEQMMPFVPFVRVRDFDEALRLAVKHEHGFGHTAIIHSNNLANITRMGRTMNTTIFVVNGSCAAGLGLGGEGYPSYSIATPTGEGITTPLTFTRFRRATIAGALRIA